MTKNDFIYELNVLKQYNRNRIKLIDFIISGISVETKTCNKIHTCMLSSWLETRELFLKRLYDPDIIRNLYLLNEEWYEESQKVCDLLTQKEKVAKKSIFGKLVKKKKFKIGEEDKDKVITYQMALKELTQKIHEILKKMKKRAEALSTEKLMS